MMNELITQRARALLEAGALVFDTETTGLGSGAELVELAIVSARAEVLLDTLVRPSADPAGCHGDSRDHRRRRGRRPDDC